MDARDREVLQIGRSFPRLGWVVVVGGVLLGVCSAVFGAWVEREPVVLIPAVLMGAGGAFVGLRLRDRGIRVSREGIRVRWFFQTVDLPASDIIDVRTRSSSFWGPGAEIEVRGIRKPLRVRGLVMDGFDARNGSPMLKYRVGEMRRIMLGIPNEHSEPPVPDHAWETFRWFLLAPILVAYWMIREVRLERWAVFALAGLGGAAVWAMQWAYKRARRSR